MSGYVKLRAKRGSHERQQVVHYYETWDELHPLRVTLCGREIVGDRLTPEGVDDAPSCVQCERHLSAACEREVSLT